jgi:hypothetical protein
VVTVTNDTVFEGNASASAWGRCRCRRRSRICEAAHGERGCEWIRRRAFDEEPRDSAPWNPWARSRFDPESRTAGAPPGSRSAEARQPAFRSLLEGDKAVVVPQRSSGPEVRSVPARRGSRDHGTHRRAVAGLIVGGTDKALPDRHSSKLAGSRRVLTARARPRR